MKKIILWVLACVAVTALCLTITCIGTAFRYFSSGVNPFRELKMATLGESLEIKETPASDGRVLRQLMIDSIDHGSQYRGNKKAGLWQNDRTPWSRVPTTYYHQDGPVGMAFHKMNWFPTRDDPMQPADARLPASLIATGASGPFNMLATAWSEPPVGVVMMNNGTPAAYARPFQCFDFFESNPRIVALSLGKDKGDRQFTHIEDAQKRGAHIRVFEGNERRTFNQESPKNFYHLLIVDTSRGHPGVPSKNLLTKEAWQGYMDAVVDDGVVCVHTSSRNFRLEEIIVATTAELGLANLHVHDGMSDRNVGHYTSSWVLVARKPGMLDHIQNAADMQNQRLAGRMPHEKINVERLAVKSALVWTDAGSNSLSGVKR